jgi:hypothetical protein
MQTFPRLDELIHSFRGLKELSLQLRQFKPSFLQLFVLIGYTPTNETEARPRLAFRSRRWLISKITLDKGP